METSVRVDGLRDIRRSLGQMEKAAPRELNKALKTAAEEDVLPAARKGTPKKTGGLAGADKVGTRGDRVLLRNTKPYANTIHFGRKTLRRGDVKHPNVVVGRPFLTDAVTQKTPEIERFMLRELERFVARSLPPS